MKLVRDSDPVRMVYSEKDGWTEALGKVEGVVALLHPVSFFDAHAAQKKAKASRLWLLFALVLWALKVRKQRHQSS